MLISNDIELVKQLTLYKKQMQQELSAILHFWQRYTPDTAFGGFYGRLDNLNNVSKNAPKGSVLNSRILWAFSAAFNLQGNKDYLDVANRAFQYIINYFIDKTNGGIYWTVDYKGEPLDTKKQMYALSFGIYGLSEFYVASKNQQAKETAIALYHLIVEHSYDKINGGYLEALSADWKEIGDLRLSKKDANEKKSMNTHLHILECFAALYRIWPDEVLKNKIEELIQIFLDHIIDKKSNHQVLFFDEQWNPKSNIISYGHDIEAAWLIQEAAEIIQNKNLIEKIKIRSVQLANAAAEGLDTDGGLWYEYEVEEKNLIKEKHSWPQAESMIGFFNAWQLTGNEDLLEKSFASWKFIQQHILDKKNGEWFWGVKENYSLMNEDKVGPWKCPYHNSRACIELIKRIDNTLKS
ncbi:AGE family epimerase/isomerase [Ginsengibacter hankyongi]|nr:AGE family epimerase/isomerase [Ginsengibacter hankyongi]